MIGYDPITFHLSGECSTNWATFQIADLENYDISTLYLTGRCSSSELQVQFIVESKGIEPSPLVLQTSVRTIYTKTPDGNAIFIVGAFPRTTFYNIFFLFPSFGYVSASWVIMDSNHSLADEIYSLAAVSKRLLLPNCTQGGTRTHKI